MSRLFPSGWRGAGRWVSLGLILAALAAGVCKIVRRPPDARFRPAGVATSSKSVPAVVTAAAVGPLGLRGEFVSTAKLVYAHAASLVELGDGRIRAFWYAGATEGSQDVTIRTATLDPVAGRWSPERVVASREDTQRALFRYVKKLGNPVVARRADGSLSLFYVTVSLGGWAGSSITMITSRDDGETWGRARRLITSPFLNLSTLVKGAALTYADGTLGLPVHHEFIGKFGELLRLDAEGAVADLVRLSAGRSCLQPVVMVEDADRALVLMRYAGKAPPKRVIATATADAGRSWSAPVKTSLSNSNAALTGLVLPDGRLLIALNDSEENRSALSLAVSGDGGLSWKTVCKVEDQSAARSQGFDDASYAADIEALARATNGAANAAGGYAESVKRQMFSKQGYSFEFSYPSLIRTSGGDFHLAYTWNEAFIKHVQFSQAWLDQVSK